MAILLISLFIVTIKLADFRKHLKVTFTARQLESNECVSLGRKVKLLVIMVFSYHPGNTSTVANIASLLHAQEEGNFIS